MRGADNTALLCSCGDISLHSGSWVGGASSVPTCSPPLPACDAHRQPPGVRGHGFPLPRVFWKVFQSRGSGGGGLSLRPEGDGAALGERRGGRGPGSHRGPGGLPGGVSLQTVFEIKNGKEPDQLRALEKREPRVTPPSGPQCPAAAAHPGGKGRSSFHRGADTWRGARGVSHRLGRSALARPTSVGCGLDDGRARR